MGSNIGEVHVANELISFLSIHLFYFSLLTTMDWEKGKENLHESIRREMFFKF